MCHEGRAVEPVITHRLNGLVILTIAVIMTSIDSGHIDFTDLNLLI